MFHKQSMWFQKNRCNPTSANALINYHTLPFMSPRSCFGSIMIIIHSMFGASGFVEQLGGNRHLNTRFLSRSRCRSPQPAVSRSPARPVAPRARCSVPNRDATPHAHLPQGPRHWVRQAQGLPQAELPRAGSAPRRLSEPAAGRVTMATLGQPGAGPPAGRGRGNLGRMRRAAFSPLPPPRYLRERRDAFGMRMRKADSAAICGRRMRPAPPRSRVGVSVGWVGDLGGRGRGAEWKPEAEAPRASKPLFPSVRRFLPCFPLSPSPNRPNCRRPAQPPAGRQRESGRQPGEGLLPSVPPPSLRGGAAGPSPPRLPASVLGDRDV